MTKRRICVLVTARPSYSRIRSALTAIQAHPDLELQLVVAASALLERYGNAIQAIERDGFSPAARVYMVLEGENLVTSAKSTGSAWSELATVFDNLKPDAVVTVADRYETLATAVAASYMNIPVVHVQGGEVTGSIDEKVRHAVTKLANLHLVSTDGRPRARDQAGRRAGHGRLTGCPSIDIAAEVAAKPELDFDPFERYGGVGPSEDLSRATSSSCSTRDHGVRGGRTQVDETLYAVEARACRCCGSGRTWTRAPRHIEGHPRFPRAREARATSISSATCFPRIFSGCCIDSHGHRRQLQRGHPRVLVPRRAGGEHRLPAAGTRAGRNVIDVEHDRGAIADGDPAITPRAAGPGGSSLRRRPRRRPHRRHARTAELAIEKRLTYSMARLIGSSMPQRRADESPRSASTTRQQPRARVGRCNLCGGVGVRRADAPRSVRLCRRARRPAALRPGVPRSGDDRDAYGAFYDRGPTGRWSARFTAG